MGDHRAIELAALSKSVAGTRKIERLAASRQPPILLALPSWILCDSGRRVKRLNRLIEPRSTRDAHLKHP